MPLSNEALERAAATLRGFSSGTLRVIESWARHDADSEGNPRVRILAVVNPPTGHRGWDVDDVLALQSRAEELLRREDPEAPWAMVELRSTDDDATGEAEVDDVEGAIRAALGE